MIEINDKRLRDYTFADLFCGIGGFHLALSSFGAKCVFASDIDANVRQVYEKNFHIVPKGDITSICLKDMPMHDILCAGFPCQPFSISGQKKGFDDESGRGKLFYEIIRIARDKKPKIILLENVKNLLYHDNGNTYATMKKKLDEIGYKVFENVLCASDYGIPQARNRLYIVGIKKKYKIKDFNFPRPLENFKVLKDILVAENRPQDSEIMDQCQIDSKQCKIDRKIAQSSARSKKLIRVGRVGKGRQGERIYSIYGQAVTLSAQGGGLGGKTGMYLVNNNVRKLHPRECARLMGFPDTYVLAETTSQCYKQFGNSVVIDVVQHIIIEILNQIGRL